MAGRDYNREAEMMRDQMSVDELEERIYALASENRRLRRDRDNWSETAQRLRIELDEQRERRAQAEYNLCRVVDEYESANPIRTADMHKPGCNCLRCAMDEARSFLDGVSQ